MNETKPLLSDSTDGVYPRCVWCNGEIYGPAVIDYSLGKIPCAAVDGCGLYLPDGYIKLVQPESEVA